MTCHAPMKTCRMNELIKNQMYPPFKEKVQDLEILVDILKNFSYPKLSGCFPAGNRISLCYPSIDSIAKSVITMLRLRAGLRYASNIIGCCRFIMTSWMHFSIDMIIV